MLLPLAKDVLAAGFVGVNLYAKRWSTDGTAVNWNAYADISCVCQSLMTVAVDDRCPTTVGIPTGHSKYLDSPEMVILTTLPGGLASSHGSIPDRPFRE